MVVATTMVLLLLAVSTPCIQAQGNGECKFQGPEGFTLRPHPSYCRLHLLCLTHMVTCCSFWVLLVELMAQVHNEILLSSPLCG